MKLEPMTDVYLESGQLCQFIGGDQSEYVVRPYYRREDEDQNGTEPSLGRPITVARVYKTPPVEIIDAEIADKARQLAELSAQVNATRTEARTVEEARKAVLARLKENDALAHIDDFISGKITHFVVQTYSAVEVFDKDAALKQDKERRWDSDIKLLCLFGDTKGDLSWRMNQYRDGSGSSWQTVYPCLSLDEAKTKAAEIIGASFNLLIAGERVIYPENLVDAARKIGMPVPDAVTKKLFAAKALALESQMQSAREALSKAEAAVQALAAEGVVEGMMI